MTYKEIGEYAESVTPPALRLRVQAGHTTNMIECWWSYSDDPRPSTVLGLGVITACEGGEKHSELVRARIDGVIEIMMKNRPRRAFTKPKEFDKPIKETP